MALRVYPEVGAKRPELGRAPGSTDEPRRHADLVSAAWTVFARITASTPAVLRKGPG
jgi:hypothetical protein